MKYLKLRIGQLKDHEKIVNLALNEVYVAAGVQYSSGRLYGEVKEKDEVVKTLFCIHISSVAGNYEDMTSMTPVVHVTKDIISVQFHRCLRALTDMRFKVHPITTDNHRTNQSFHNSLGDDGKHPLYVVNPYAKDHHVYPLYDTVHLLKNLYYGLLNCKELRPPPFPGEVCFQSFIFFITSTHYYMKVLFGNTGFLLKLLGSIISTSMHTIVNIITQIL